MDTHTLPTHTLSLYIVYLLDNASGTSHSSSEPLIILVIVYPSCHSGGGGLHQYSLIHVAVVSYCMLGDDANFLSMHLIHTQYKT